MTHLPTTSDLTRWSRAQLVQGLSFGTQAQIAEVGAELARRNREVEDFCGALLAGGRA